MKAVPLIPAYDPNLTLGRLLVSIAHNVASLREIVENLGLRLEEPYPAEWRQLVHGIIEALQDFQRRIEDEDEAP